MNKELKEKWLAALRSGKYQQGYTYLSAHGKYCCLGVLCDIAGLEKTAETSFSTLFLLKLPGEPATYMRHSFPEKAIEFFGLNKAQHNDLIAMNDGHAETGQHSFREIADWIEHNIEDFSE